MAYFYSPGEIGFYDDAIKEVYEKAGTWPEDAVEITDKSHAKYTGQPPEGKKLGTVNGKPGWVDIPKLTEEQLTELNELTRKDLISFAKSEMFFLQTKLLIGKATDEEKKTVSSWIDYIDELSAVDLTKPVWPEAPQS